MKRCQKQNMNVQKSSEKHSYRMPSAMIFIDFGLLRIDRTAFFPYLLLLKSAEVTQIW